MKGARRGPTLKGWFTVVNDGQTTALCVRIIKREPQVRVRGVSFIMGWESWVDRTINQEILCDYRLLNLKIGKLLRLKDHGDEHSVDLFNICVCFHISHLLLDLTYQGCCLSCIILDQWNATDRGLEWKQWMAEHPACVGLCRDVAAYTLALSKSYRPPWQLPVISITFKHSSLDSMTSRYRSVCDILTRNFHSLLVTKHPWQKIHMQTHPHASPD